MPDPTQIAVADEATFGNTVEDHRMEGYAIHGGRFSVPLISHVTGGLWQGGCIGGVRLPDDFDYVLSLYPWEKYVLGEKTSRDEVKMYDSPGQTFEQVDELATNVRRWLDDGAKVLVHCQAGLNRSGLLAARVLTLGGMSGVEAIALLREKRCDMVLCNRAFEQHIAGIPAS